MKEEHWENVIAFLIVAVVVAGVVWWFMTARHASTVPAQQEPRVQVPFGISPRIGNESAPVVVIEFSDFQCPFCGQFAKEFPDIKQQYIDTGQVLFIYKYYPLTGLHAHALLAAQAGACADAQGKFWEYHDVVYAHQDALEQTDLEQYAVDIGVNTTKFNMCLKNGERLPDVQLDMKTGNDEGVTGTPTFFFNGRRVAGLLSAAQFGAEVQKELASN